MIRKKHIQMIFKDPYLGNKLEFAIIPIDRLQVISFQRKPSLHHIKHLSSSIERIGFIVPVIVVEESEGNYTIVDGQHRYLAAKELGIRELPAVIIPQELARLMMNFNIEKELNIREKAYVALNIYRQYLDNQPEIMESNSALIDSIEQAYYVTLGLVYEQYENIAGSIFEPILKKCDLFLDEKLEEAIKIREQRATIVIDTYNIIKNIAAKLKELNKWHPYINQQILSLANPYRHKKLPTEFDDIFQVIRENLKSFYHNPQLIFDRLSTEIFNE
ncbi:MAG: chromosome partitioning protein ParB [Candidatus Parcubacteria bacterium]|nr:MAG: chromosome partitioning protein ParB [Candidatus Parcubacteria bacterium]